MAKNSQPPDFSAAQESARQAAVQADLGEPTGAAFANRVRSRRFLNKISFTGEVVCEFDSGLVLVHNDQTARAFGFDEVASVTEKCYDLLDYSRYLCTLFCFTLTREDGAAMQMTGVYGGQAGPAPASARYRALGESVAQRVCAAQIPAARAALARGDTLAFGRHLAADAECFISRYYGTITIPWEQVTVSVSDHGLVHVTRTGSKVSQHHTLFTWDVPNFRLLAALASEHGAHVSTTPRKQP